MVYACPCTTRAAGNFAFYRENDGPSVQGSDRHYTSGVELLYAFQPDWVLLEQWSDLPGLSGSDRRTAAVFLLGQRINTPDHVDKPSIRDEKDWRFSGHLYIGAALQRATDRAFEQVVLNVGIIGPAAQADDTQTWVHRVMGAPQPEGWENQLDDEATVDLTWQRKTRWRDGSLSLGAFSRDYDVIPHTGLTVGTVNRRLNAGLLMRLGTHLPRDVGPGRVGEPQDFTLPSAKPQRGHYLFVRTDGYVVEHNRYLEGLTERPLVGQLQVGLMLLYDHWQISLSHLVKTLEFEGQNSIDTHGALTVNYQY